MYGDARETEANLQRFNEGMICRGMSEVKETNRASVVPRDKQQQGAVTTLSLQGHLCTGMGVCVWCYWNLVSTVASRDGRSTGSCAKGEDHSSRLTGREQRINTPASHLLPVSCLGLPLTRVQLRVQGSLADAAWGSPPGHRAGQRRHLYNSIESILTGRCGE